jgi:Ca-activated chloride channel homolog
MTCVTQQTGGSVFEARDGAAVASGLKEALTLANILGANQPNADMSLPLNLDANGPPQLRLSAALSKGGPPITNAVTWRVKSSTAPDTIVKEGKVPVLAAEVPEGRYTIEASYGLSKAETTVDVAAKGPTIAEIALNAGILKVSSLNAKSIATATDPAIVVSALDDATGIVSPLFVGRDTQAELVVPAGRYRIEAGDGLAMKTEDVMIEPGASVTSEMAMSAGRLQISAISHAGGGAVEGATIMISTDDPDTPNGRREITRSSAAAPEFMLPAGTYYVTVKVGSSETKERVAISTGDVVKRPIILNGAWMSLTTTHDGRLVPNGSPVVFRVYPKTIEKDGSANGIVTERSETGGLAPNVFLPFGNYRVEATLGRQNVKGDTLIEVTAGVPSAIPVKIAVSEVIIRPPSDAGSAASLYWELRDGRGKIVQRSAGALAEKVLLIAPGAYVLRSETGEKSTDLSLDLKAGDRRTVSMPLN